MIKIICVGSIKEKYLKEAASDYLKRIQKYTKIEIVELEDNSSERSLEIEKEKILSKIKNNEFIITLEILGKKMDTVEFAKILDKTFIHYSTITFIIGGSNGLHDDIKKISKLSLSFSDFTFPHQLFRVLLLEQVYRVYKINNNESYHK